MRMGPCAAYAPSGQPGYWFDRRRAAARQDFVARSRNANMLKRRQRDEEEEASASAGRAFAYDPQSQRRALDGLKRMRLSTPPMTPPASPTSFDMMTDDDEKAKKGAALVATRVWQEPTVLKPTVPGGWQQVRGYGYYSDALEMPAADENCTAMVVFDPHNSRPLAPVPRVELVESDDDSGSRSSSDEEQPQGFVRFEEIAEDDDEPMEID